jgi:DNA polymerase sigma
MEQSTVRKSTDDEEESIPLSFKIAVLWRQIKMLSRELKFRWQTLNELLNLMNQESLTLCYSL